MLDENSATTFTLVKTVVEEAFMASEALFTMARRAGLTTGTQGPSTHEEATLKAISTTIAPQHRVLPLIPAIVTRNYHCNCRGQQSRGSTVQAECEWINNLTKTVY